MRNKIVQDAWEFYSYPFGDGLRAFIRFDVAAAKEPAHSGFSHGERVLLQIPPEDLYPNGTPRQQIFQKLSQFESGLVRHLEKKRIACRLVGVMTYAGLRDFVFQVESPEAFDKAVSLFLRHFEGAVTRKQYSGWTFFDEKVRPDAFYWGQIGDRHVIEGLLQAGSDPEKPHVLEHFIYGKEADLEKLANNLIEQGFEKVSLRDGCLQLNIAYPLNPEMIFRMTGYLRDTCEKLNLSYDGWGASVVS
jgi:regulator of RNase E activity RraB